MIKLKEVYYSVEELVSHLKQEFDENEISIKFDLSYSEYAEFYIEKKYPYDVIENKLTCTRNYVEFEDTIQSEDKYGNRREIDYINFDSIIKTDTEFYITFVYTDTDDDHSVMIDLDKILFISYDDFIFKTKL